MTCREKILSEDYADLLLRFTLSQNLLPEYQSDSCYVRVEGDISVVYLSLAEAGEIQISTLTYQSIPQIFGLMMDGMQPGQPAGRQELIIRCRSFAEVMEAPGSWQSGIRRFRMVPRRQGICMERNIQGSRSTGRDLQWTRK